MLVILKNPTTNQIIILGGFETLSYTQERLNKLLNEGWVIREYIHAN